VAKPACINVTHLYLRRKEHIFRLAHFAGKHLSKNRDFVQTNDWPLAAPFEGPEIAGS